MEEKITKQNVIIAEFMGYENVAGVNHYPIYKIPSQAYESPNFDNRTMDTIDTFSPYFDDMKFHTDWNWLMPVVEMIEKIQVGSYIDFHIMPDAVIVRDQIDETKPLIIINKSERKGSIETHSVMFETKIQAVYTAVVEFIKWYNANK